MATSKQRSAALRNIKKAATAAKRKRTIAHLPEQTRTALGREGRRLPRASASDASRNPMRADSRFAHTHACLSWQTICPAFHDAFFRPRLSARRDRRAYPRRARMSTSRRQFRSSGACSAVQ
jgi:hypothetical protein